jgi:hypothetical protein
LILPLVGTEIAPEHREGLYSSYLP